MRLVLFFTRLNLSSFTFLSLVIIYLIIKYKTKNVHILYSGNMNFKNVFRTIIIVISSKRWKMTIWTNVKNYWKLIRSMWIRAKMVGVRSITPPCGGLSGSSSGWLKMELMLTQKARAISAKLLFIAQLLIGNRQSWLRDGIFRYFSFWQDQAISKFNNKHLLVNPWKFLTCSNHIKLISPRKILKEQMLYIY